MLNVLHGRFVANPAQNSPSHIMKGGKKHKCQQFHTGTGLDTPASPPLLSSFTHGPHSLPPRHPATPFLSLLRAMLRTHTHQILRLRREERSAVPPPFLSDSCDAPPPPPARPRRRHLQLSGPEVRA